MKKLEFIPSGCAVLDLHLSGRVGGAFLRGGITHIVGDSDTGKTLEGLTICAEVCHDPRYKDFEIIYDQVEPVNFNIGHMFGEATEKRIAKGGKRWEGPSQFVEEFYARVNQLQQEGKPFLYVLDTMDKLESLPSQAAFEEMCKRVRSGATLKGSYGDGKAAINSRNLRKLQHMLEPTGSVLIIISQTRDVLDAMSFKESTHAGGRALKFYAASQVWLAKRGDMTRSLGGKQRKCGTIARFKVTKNHTSGMIGWFDCPMPYGFGLDDAACCGMWMVEYAGWKIAGGVLSKGKTSFTMKTIRRDPAAIRELHQTLQAEWDEYQSKIRETPRYHEGGPAVDLDTDAAAEEEEWA